MDIAPSSNPYINFKRQSPVKCLTKSNEIPIETLDWVFVLGLFSGSSSAFLEAHVHPCFGVIASRASTSGQLYVPWLEDEPTRYHLHYPTSFSHTAEARLPADHHRCRRKMKVGHRHNAKCESSEHDYGHLSSPVMAVVNNGPLTFNRKEAGRVNGDWRSRSRLQTAADACADDVDGAEDDQRHLSCHTTPLQPCGLR
ncbi:hypothetical protein J6590_067295 [Homalodisca vitripennis]|nr:hypothetical protein J6590_067295 [Homalodisca vitripennis]